MDDHVNKAVSILGADTAERGRYLKQLQTAAIWTAVILLDTHVKAFCCFLLVPGREGMACGGDFPSLMIIVCARFCSFLPVAPEHRASLGFVGSTSNSYTSS